MHGLKFIYFSLLAATAFGMTSKSFKKSKKSKKANVSAKAGNRHQKSSSSKKPLKNKSRKDPSSSDDKLADLDPSLSPIMLPGKQSKKGTLSPTRTRSPTKSPAPTMDPYCYSDLIADGTAVIPESWINVPDNAFGDCGELKRVQIPNKIEEIGQGAFEGSALEEITFENGSVLETIGSNAFAYTQIVSIEIPTSVRVLGDFVFENSFMLESLSFEAGSALQEIGEWAFDRTKIASIIVPAAVTEITDYVFMHAEALTSITFESGTALKNIEPWAFFTTNVTSINLPMGVEIGEDAFYGTPCPDKTVFQPGNTVVDCEVQSPGR
mmetsp:Transcript_1358/g.2940  ORF Transcript_1358/g.2940 Transcript_1358/m.2940 type:complete len:324 (+) Transcript_1358:129-1100(+)